MSKDPVNSFDASDPTPPQSTDVTPEILAWALSHFNEEETLAGLREIRTTGGKELKEFLHEIDQELAPRE